LDQTKDADLAAYLDADDARQMLHIAYGFVLADAALKAEMASTLKARRPAYARAIRAHMQRHLTSLGLFTK
jgi:hypothetical protein